MNFLSINSLHISSLRMWLSLFLLFACALVQDAYCRSETPLACELAARHQQCRADASGGQCLPDLSDNRRLIAIGDVHGSLSGLLEILYEAKITSSPNSCTWREQGSNKEDGVILVQVGDLVDRGPDAWGAFECLRNLQKDAAQHNSKVVRLLGNHDIWWLNGYFHHRNTTADTQIVLRQVIVTMINDIKEGTLQLAYAHARHDVPLLFVHAGVSPAFYKYLQKTLHPGAPTTQLSAVEVAKYANTQLQQDFSACTALPCQDQKSSAKELYEAGPDRGGAGIGGPLWTDFSVLEKAAKNHQDPSHFIQVVGHTMAFCYSPRHMNLHPPSHVAECADGLVRASHLLQAVCVDGGMYIGARAYLELGRDAHFVAHERYRGEPTSAEYNQYAKRDLTQVVCKSV